MALQMRNFLSVDEMAGVPVSQSQNIDANTGLTYGKILEQGARNQVAWAQVDELKQVKAESDAWNKRFAANLSATRPQEQPAPQVDAQPSAPAQVAPIPQQVNEPAVASPVRMPAPDNSQPLAPNIQTTGDFARYDRQLPAPAAAPVQPAEAPAPQQVTVTGQRMTPEQKAAYDAQNPPAQEQQAPAVQAPGAAEQPTPAQEVQAVAQAPVAKAPPLATYSNAIRSTPVGPQGQFNPMSDDYLKVMQQTLMESVRAGEMRPSTASSIFMASQSAVTKGIEDRYKMLKAGAEAREAGLKGDKLVEELAQTKRTQQIENAQIVLNTFKESPAAAQAILAPMGFGGMDLSNPEHLKALAGLASSSKEGVEARKDARGKVETQTAGLPDGFFRKTKDDPTVYKMGEDGKPVAVGQKEIDAATQAQRKAGAPSTTILTGDNPYGGKGDEEFAKGVGKDDAEQLRALRTGSIAVQRNIDNYKQIQSLVTNPDGTVKNDLPLGPGQGLVGLAERLGIKDKNEMGLFVRNMVGQASAALELDAAGMMKGQGAITDNERAILRKAAAGDFANFTAKEWADYSKVMQRASVARIESNNSEIANIGKRRGLKDLSTWQVPTTQYADIKALPAQPNTPIAAPAGLPQVGATVNGYKFLGGDPNNKANWAKQ